MDLYARADEGWQGLADGRMEEGQNVVIKFELADNVYMTDEGLMKRCETCERLLPLEDFPVDKHRVYTRGTDCRECERRKGGANDR